MLARSRKIRLSKGIEFDTPLLVPALSSRALGPLEFEDEETGKIRPAACSIVHSHNLLWGIDWALLISAYDICYGLLTDSEALRVGFARSRYAELGVLIIDSGWYEKAGSALGGAFIEGLNSPNEWEKADFEKTIDGLDNDIRAVVVSWDHEGPYREQIAQAQDFFAGRPRFASAILLKRPGGSRFHHLKGLSGDDVENLRCFDLIGVTEKELGDSILDRLVTLASLRTKLDEADVSSPIQVFGGLDPLHTPLYFAAGGEVFDGLGWLRYAYRDGLAVNREEATILDGQTGKREKLAMNMISLQNLDALRGLTEGLRLFADQGGDWSKIGPRGEDLRPVYERLEERLKGRGRHGK